MVEQLITKCPYCNLTYEASEELDGADIVCENCGKEFIVVIDRLEDTVPEEKVTTRHPCPVCGEMIMPSGRKCRFCGEVFDSNISSPSTTPIVNTAPVVNAAPVVNVAPAVDTVAKGVDYGAGLLLSPLLCLVLLFFSPIIYYGIITLFMVFLTAILVGIEANINYKLDAATKKQGPNIFWIGTILMWVVAYPYYLWYRKNYGLNSLSLWGILIIFAFAVIVWIQLSRLALILNLH